MPHKCRHCSRAQCSKECGWRNSIYPVFLSASSGVDALFIRSPAHTAMPLAVQGSELPTGHRRTLYRRSSCPSIPRSVSACSSIYAIDFSGQFSLNRAEATPVMWRYICRRCSAVLGELERNMVKQAELIARYIHWSFHAQRRRSYRGL